MYRSMVAYMDNHTGGGDGDLAEMPMEEQLAVIKNLITHNHRIEHYCSHVTDHVTCDTKQNFGSDDPL